jgi:hypothetical protein
MTWGLPTRRSRSLGGPRGTRAPAPRHWNKKRLAHCFFRSAFLSRLSPFFFSPSCLATKSEPKRKKGGYGEKEKGVDGRNKRFLRFPFLSPFFSFPSCLATKSVKRKAGKGVDVETNVSFFVSPFRLSFFFFLA